MPSSPELILGFNFIMCMMRFKQSIDIDRIVVSSDNRKLKIYDAAARRRAFKIKAFFMQNKENE